MLSNKLVLSLFILLLLSIPAEAAFYDCVGTGCRSASAASKESASSSSKKAAVKKKVVKKTKQSGSSSSKMTSAELDAWTKGFCAANQEWTCGEWSVCGKDGSQTRVCKRDPKVSLVCKKGEKPQMYKACSIDRTGDNLKEWKKLHEEILAKAEKLANMKNATSCVQTLDNIEEEFVLRYNEYVGYLNSPANFQYGSAMRQIEDAMKKIRQEFEEAPSICY